MTLSFWILGSLTACHSPKTPALAKMLLAYAMQGVQGVVLFS
jgi:hypothetical protein